MWKEWPSPHFPPKVSTEPEMMESVMSVVMSKSSVVVESASKDSDTFVVVTDTVPKVMGASTPQELEPMHDESWLKWWMSENISAKATDTTSRLYHCQKKEVVKQVNCDTFRDDDDNTTSFIIVHDSDDRSPRYKYKVPSLKKV